MDEPTCPVCQGNDSDAPCAYPSERLPGCLRDIRLERATTKCAKCYQEKYTPLFIAWLGGYVCLTCIDKALAVEHNDSIRFASRLADAELQRDKAQRQYESMRNICHRATDLLAERAFDVERWVEWVEPHGHDDHSLYLPTVIRATVADVIEFQRSREPRYETDDMALDDFLVVHWATIKEYPRGKGTETSSDGHADGLAAGSGS